MPFTSVLQPSSSKWRLIGYLLVGAFLLALGYGLNRWFSHQDHFPRLPPGSYRGTLELEGRSGPFLIWVANDGSRATFVIGSGQLKTGSVALQAVSETHVAPLHVDDRLKISGSFDLASGKASGRVSDVQSGQSGRWTLAREVSEESGGPPPNVARDALIAFRQAQESLAAVEAEKEQLTKTLEQISAAAVDNPDFRSVAEQRLGSTKKNADQLEREIQERQASVDRLAEKLKNSAHVSAMGRLVSLGRESLRQDGQWIQSVLLRLAPETSGDFDKNLQRARSVDQLKRQIEDERRRIADLRSRESEIERGDPYPDRESDSYE